MSTTSTELQRILARLLNIETREVTREATTNATIIGLKEENVELRQAIVAMKKNLQRMEDNEEKAEDENSRLREVIGTLSDRMKNLEAENERLKETVETVSGMTKEIQEYFKQMSGLRRVLCRSLVDRQNIPDLYQKLDNLKSRVDVIENLTETVEEKMENEMQTQLEDLTNRVASLEQKEQRVKDSIFCARLDPREDSTRLYPMTKCLTAYSMGSGAFDHVTGCIKPKVDGVYNVAWNIRQMNDGKMKYFMSIKGLEKHTIVLGSTHKDDEVCSGSMVIPLMTQHSVWLQAMRISGEDTGIINKCYLMGYLLETNDSQTLEDLNALHKRIFRPVQKSMMRQNPEN